jgi:hypothetical protein
MSITETGVVQVVTASVTLTAKQDLSSHIYRFMSIVTGGLDHATGSTWITGVLQNKPTSGKAAVLAIGGLLKVEVGGAVTVDQQVESDSEGRAVVKSGAGYTGGVALQTRATAGEFVTILFQPCYFAA